MITVWLILGALGFGAIMEQAGFLDRLVKGVLAKAKSGGALVATVIGTAIGLNIIAADQYIAIVLPSRTFRLEFKTARLQARGALADRRGLAARSPPCSFRGTPAAPITPACWASRRLTTAPYCFFNIINPILSLIYGFTGFHMEKYAPGEAPPVDEAATLPLVEETAVLQPVGEV